MLNLMTGLGGYTLCSGIICEDLNGGGFRAVPLDDDEVMHIGVVYREDASLSAIAAEYIENLKKYRSLVL